MGPFRCGEGIYRSIKRSALMKTELCKCIVIIQTMSVAPLAYSMIYCKDVCMYLHLLENFQFAFYCRYELPSKLWLFYIYRICQWKRTCRNIQNNYLNYTTFYLNIYGILFYFIWIYIDFLLSSHYCNEGQDTLTE